MSRVVDRTIRRDDIVSAAAELFSKRGVAQTPVSDIVKAAGVAQGTFYLYFKAKDDVVVAVAERFGDAMINRIEQAVAEPRLSSIEKLLALGDTLAGAAAAGVHDLIETVHRRGNRAIHDRLVDHLTPRLASVVESIIKQGISDGVFKISDLHIAAWFILGGLRGVELSGIPVVEMPAALAEATTLALRALGYMGESK